jgi:hypothetical protein
VIVNQLLLTKVVLVLLFKSGAVKVMATQPRNALLITLQQVFTALTVRVLIDSLMY